MRPLRVLLIYLALVFVGAALLAPWLYLSAQWGSGRWPALGSISAQPFHRYVNRSLLGLALLGLWPFLRGIGADSWAAAGLVKPSGNWGRWTAGFALGFASLACVTLLTIAAGLRTVKTDLPATVLMKKAGASVLTAIVAGFLEELLFRGALFGALRRAHRWTTALIVSSAVYALVHFFQRPSSPANITWSSGLEMLPRMCQGFVDFQMLVPGFFALLLAGIILGVAYERTGNLYLSIGLHAGWIFWLKFYGILTVESSVGGSWFWGSSKLIDGWLALGILLPMLVLIWSFPQAPAPHAE